jgi:hypothetical protein
MGTNFKFGRGIIKHQSNSPFMRGLLKLNEARINNLIKNIRQDNNLNRNENI